MIGFFGGVANLWLSQSYKFSEVSLVTPLKYLALVFAIGFGYLIWQEIPSSKTLIGAALVITSSIIIFRREIIIKKKDKITKLLLKTNITGDWDTMTNVFFFAWNKIWSTIHLAVWFFQTQPLIIMKFFCSSRKITTILLKVGFCIITNPLGNAKTILVFRCNFYETRFLGMS